jgi:taurine transport system permease protein
MTETTTVKAGGRAEPLRLTAKNSRPGLLLVSFLSALGLLCLWELLCRSNLVDPILLPSPVQVFNRGVAMASDGSLVWHVLASTRRVMIGFLAAVAVAIPLGIFIGTSKLASAASSPVLSLLRPLPSMSWVPLTMLWLGMTETQKYSIVFLGTLAPALMFVIETTKNVDPILIKAARNLGASNFQVMQQVILPASLSQILGGLKVILGLSWSCVISAELVAAQQGLGFLIMNGREYFQTETVILGMVMISLTVLITDIAVRQLEKRILVWQQ